MKRFGILCAAAAMSIAGAANAVTVANSIDWQSSTGVDLSFTDNPGRSVTFVFDVDTGTSGSEWSGAFQFTLPDRAKISFDLYDTTAADQQSGFVLYQPGGASLTSSAPAGTTGGGVPLVNARDRILVGGPDSSGVQAGTVLYDAIDGSDSVFSGGDWVIGVYDSGNPSDVRMEFTVSAVPLPASALLLLGGVGALALRARRKPA